MKNASVTLVPIKILARLQILPERRNHESKNRVRNRNNKPSNATKIAITDLSKHQRSSSRCSVRVMLAMVVTVRTNTEIAKKGKG